jgi:hypothetical protein
MTLEQRDRLLLGGVVIAIGVTLLLTGFFLDSEILEFIPLTSRAGGASHIMRHELIVPGCFFALFGVLYIVLGSKRKKSMVRP